MPMNQNVYKPKNRLQLLKRNCRVLVLMLSATLFSTLYAQNITVRGKVTDDKGSPIAGASVTLKTAATGGDNTGRGTGASTGTSTSATGDYTISVARNATLVFSSVGLTSKEVPVNGKTTINIALNTSATDLDQVVVVGYGTQRKEAVTGSVASIGGEKLRDVPTPNISQALQGRLAGVDVTQTSSQPGAGMQIRIRGDRSLTNSANDPLIVLDGIPFVGNLSNINPNDVKSIDVLKDASATAIYGSRGSNGVILVTTNRGQKGQKARFSYNTYTGLQTLFAKYPMMNNQEYLALRNYAGYVTNTGADEKDTTVNTDWQRLLFRNGIVTDHSISMVAGSQQGSYSFGLGYYQNQGIIPTQRYTRYSMKASVDQQVGNYVRFGLTSNTNYNLSQGNQVGLYNNLALTPIANPYNPDGSLKRIVSTSQDMFYPLTKDRLDSLKDRGTFLNESKGFATYNSMYGEISIPGIKGLKYRLNVGADYITSNGGSFTGANVNSTVIGQVSSASINTSQTFHWTVENILSYDRTFGKHNISALGLYSAEQNTANGSSLSATDIGTDNFQYYNLGSALPNNISVGQGTYTQSGLMSGMGRIIYGYDNRYLLQATLRSDGSSRLAPGNKWHTYPAVSVGWNLANESFVQKNVPVISSFKLRAGFGQTSNQAIAPYSTLGVLSSRNSNFGPTNYAIGYYISRAPNPSLSWEFSKTLNLGLDFGLFRNRLSGTLEYYNTKTEGILQDLSLPPTSGVGVISQNIGKTQNKGIELTLNGTILNNVGGFTWDAGFNISFNRNKLIELADGKTRDEANAWFVGYNINSIYDYQKIGLWQANDPYRSVLQPGDSTQVVGSIKVLYTGDYSANGVPTRAINASDRQITNVTPDFTGGFNTRFAYKGFDLSIVGLFKSGGVLISSLYGSASYLNTETGRRNNLKIDYWTPTNTGAKYPRPGKNISGDNPLYQSTNSYFDASFLKLRTIQIGYDFNQSLMKNSSIKLRMYATVQNPFVLFSPYKKETGMDPETNSFGNQNQAVSGYQSRLPVIGYNTPALRNYILGLNFTF